ncbi:MAG: hypothetical protein IPF98_25510 [Gemmatimonadetes bacterium]|nr:hypothetical protein [Gemmatimonadota bacterium]
MRAGVLVPQGFDEREALFDIRRRALASPDALLLTLAPTIQCNFRCTYCFGYTDKRQWRRRLRATSCGSSSRSRRGAPHHDDVVPAVSPAPARHRRARPALHQRVGASRGIAVKRGIVTNGYFLADDMVARLQRLGAWRWCR